MKERTQETKDTQKEVIWALSELMENRSQETAQHVKRVGMYAELLARKAGLNQNEIDLLKISSPMHDIGKIAIPDHIS